MPIEADTRRKYVPPNLYAASWHDFQICWQKAALRRVGA